LVPQGLANDPTFADCPRSSQGGFGIHGVPANPPGHVVVEVGDVIAGAAVADVAVGSDQSGQRSTARVVQDAGGGVGGEPVQDDQAA
jgi:hypothetical protein